MTFEYFLMNFGYAAVLVGTFLEGETILVLGGFFAHRGYMSLPLVILFAFLGSFIGDQIYFFIGRRKGIQYIEKRPWLEPRIRKFKKLLDKYNTVIILVFRFLYGLRTVSPFVIGLSRISAVRFFILNAISAIVWAVVVAAAGYYFGRAIEIIIDDVKHYEIEIIIAVVLLFILRSVYLYLKNRRKNDPAGSDY